MSERLLLLLAALFFTALVGCAQQPTAASGEASISNAAELLARAWGAEKGTSREALALGVVRSIVGDPVLAAAWKSKPTFTSDEVFWNRLEKEGFAMLSDDALRRAVKLKLKLLQDATPEECASYHAMTASGAIFGPESEKWRKRLSRASDDDFWQSMQLSKEAILERARRLNETPLILSKKEYEGALSYIILALPLSTREELLAAAQRGAEMSANEACRFGIEMLKVQAEIAGQDAYLPLRIGYAGVRD